MDESFEISYVEIDKMKLNHNICVNFKEVKDGIIYFTDNGWW